MGFHHGIRTYEVPTQVQSPRVGDNLPVIIGVSAINRAKEPKVNFPQILFNIGEAYNYFGYIKDYENYTLSESIDVFFKHYAMAPVVFINVLDPKKHKKSVPDQAITLSGTEKEVLEPAILLDSLVVKDGTSATTYTKDIDYLTQFTEDGFQILTLDGGAIAVDSTLKITYDVIDPTQVTKNDIIGGIDINTGAKTGMELIDSVFTETRKVPTILAAPKFGEDPAVAALLDTKADNINKLFKAISVVDASESETVYTKIPKWKNDNNIVSSNQIVCWPKIKLGDDVIRLSQSAIGLMLETDYLNKGVPKESPSNKNLKMNGMVVKTVDGYKTINLDNTQAGYLNENGIVTALNFIGGWVLWGNRTACFPANRDVKDNFINVKRMFFFYQTSFILTHWKSLDKTGSKRLIESIKDTENEKLNGEIAKENIIAGNFDFRKIDNPKTDLISGQYTFNYKLTIGTPAESIIANFEYDVSGLDNLF